MQGYNPYTAGYGQGGQYSGNNSYYSQSEGNQFGNVDNYNEQRYFTYNQQQGEKPIMDVNRRRDMDFGRDGEEDTEEDESVEDTESAEEEESDDSESSEEEEKEKKEEEEDVKEGDDYSIRVSMRNNHKVEIVVEEVDDIKQRLKSIFPDFDQVKPSFGNKASKKKSSKARGHNTEAKIKKPPVVREKPQEKFYKTSDNFGNRDDNESVMSFRSIDSRGSSRRDNFMKFRDNYFGSVKSEFNSRKVEDVSSRFMRKM